MDDLEFRLECMRLAHHQDRSAADCVERARKFADFVIYNKSSEPPKKPAAKKVCK